MARRKKSKLNLVYGLSLGAHLAVGAALALIPQQKLREVVAIALNEVPPKDEKKAEPPKPKEHPPEARQARAPRAPRSNAAHAAAAAASSGEAPAFTNLGLTLDSAAVGGLAVNIAPVASATKAEAPAELVMKPKVLTARHTEAVCDEPLQKARPLEMVRPAYTEDARRARVEGRVRIELAVNDQGLVSEARVLEGLGHGLDEAALEAARRLRFTPAMHCRKAVSAPFIIAMRFVLGT